VCWGFYASRGSSSFDYRARGIWARLLMRFELVLGNESVWAEPPWQIERINRAGDARYLVACFEFKQDAEECMRVLEKSMEVKRGGSVYA